MVIKSSSAQKKWWKEHIIYQIYPRSFKDSSGNGIGDLQGIIEKLDYIKSLGVTAVWINPIYASPNDDNGYDISDYRAISPEFGTMQDFEELLAGLEQRDIHFVMDLVANHTSDEHPWFQQSRSSRVNPYRDYYHWWPAEKGKPNFRWSYFDEKGEAWKYDEQTDAYYLHYFSQKQPDLNWENPKVRQEIYDIMTFWADKGVQGFRLDAFQFVSKDTAFPKLPDEYENNIGNIIKYHGMGPNLHAYLREMNEQVLSKYPVFAVSEGAGSSFQDAHDLVDEDRQELQIAYHFELVNISTDADKPHTLLEFKQLHNAWEESFAEKGWLSVFLANHDLPRMVSKFGNDSPEYRELSAKLLNTYLLTSRGTPFCYFGDELGMTNIGFEDIEQYKDIAAINGYKKAQHEGADLGKYMRDLKAHSRDNSRTPMQWDDSISAGFSEKLPWINVNANKNKINVETQEKDKNSILNYFRRLVKLRRENPVLVYGDYQPILSEHPGVFIYLRSDENQRILVLLNYTESEQNVEIPCKYSSLKVLINNCLDSKQLSHGVVELKPLQSLVCELI